MSNLAKYQPWTSDAAATEQEEAARNPDGILKLGQGRTLLRFLPPKIGMPGPFVRAEQHYVDLPNGTSVSFNCPRLMGRKFCPCCARAEELAAAGNAADFKLAEAMRAKRRVYANVVDRGDEESGPRVFAFGKTIHEALLALRTDATVGGDFTDPGPRGFDILIYRKGEKLSTEYTVQPVSNRLCPLSSDAATADAWLDTMKDLRSYALIPSPEEIVAKLGILLPPPVDVSRRQPARRPAPKPAPARTAADDVEQVDED